MRKIMRWIMPKSTELGVQASGLKGEIHQGEDVLTHPVDDQLEGHQVEVYRSKAEGMLDLFVLAVTTLVNSWVLRYTFAMFPPSALGKLLP